MRIICPQCAAAYTIEDGQVALRGVRAQCPKCRHLHRVRAPMVASGEMVDPGFLDDSGVPNPEELRPGGEIEERHHQLPPSEASWKAREAQLLDAMRQVENVLPSPPKLRTQVSLEPVRGVTTKQESVVARPSSASAYGRMTLIAFLGLALGVAAAWYLMESTPKNGLEGAWSKDDSEKVMGQILQEWQASLPSFSGEALSYVESGMRNLEKDMPSAYVLAEQDFQRALILNPESDDAVLGYLQALAWGRGKNLDGKTQRQAEVVLRVAERRGSNEALKQLARALWLLATEQDLLNVRKLASRASEIGNRNLQAVSHLILAESFVTSNLVLAKENIDKALELSPRRRRVLRVKALVAEAAGDVGEQIQNLEKHLELAQDDWQALLDLVRKYVEVDQSERAIELLRENKVFGVQSALVRAQIRYQRQNRLDEAVSELQPWVSQDVNVDTATRSLAFGHLAAAYRLQGQWELAEQAAMHGLVLNTAELNCRLQLFLLAMAKELPGVARGHFVLMAGKLSDVVTEKLLEGVLLRSEKKLQAAWEAFIVASELDAKRPVAKLLASMTAAEMHKPQEAFRMLHQAMSADPLGWESDGTLFEAYVSTRDVLHLSKSFFESLREDSNDINPDLAEGFFRWTLGDLARAEKHLGRVLSFNKVHAGAMALLAASAVRQGNKALALDRSQAAVSLGPTEVYNRFILGEAFRLNQQWEEARNEYLNVLSIEPSMLAAKTRWAQVEGKLGNVAPAREALRRIIQSHETYWEAQRVLFSLSPN